jgi:hypothetical protein
MARNDDWKVELRDALRHDVWSLLPPRRIVKAVPLERPPMTEVQGYVTLEVSLIGRTPRELEGDLGLPSGLFARGCRVYRLARLPRAEEIEYELTAEHPDGLAFDAAAAHNELLLRRLDPTYVASPIYGPGRPAVHQWRLTSKIPVGVVLDLLPNVSYPYPRL